MKEGDGEGMEGGDRNKRWRRNEGGFLQLNLQLERTAKVSFLPVVSVLY